MFLRDTDSLRAPQASGITGARLAFGPDATFAIDLWDEPAAERLLAEPDLEPGRFLCAIPRLSLTTTAAAIARARVPEGGPAAAMMARAVAGV